MVNQWKMWFSDTEAIGWTYDNEWTYNVGGQKCVKNPVFVVVPIWGNSIA